MANASDFQTIGAGFNNKLQVRRFIYDFANDGGAQSTIVLGTFAKEMVLLKAHTNVKTALTSGGSAKVKIGVGTNPGAILAETAYGSITNVMAPAAASVEVQTLTPSGVVASGNYKLNFAGDITGFIAYDANAATIQTAIRTLDGLEAATVSGTLATAITVTMAGYSGNAALLTVSNSDLATSAPAAVTLTVASTLDGSVVANGLKAAVDDNLSMVISGADLTAGKIEVVLVMVPR